jgi:hypothetical protein
LEVSCRISASISSGTQLIAREVFRILNVSGLSTEARAFRSLSPVSFNISRIITMSVALTFAMLAPVPHLIVGNHIDKNFLFVKCSIEAAVFYVKNMLAEKY